TQHRGRARPPDRGAVAPAVRRGVLPPAGAGSPGPAPDRCRPGKRACHLPLLVSLERGRRRWRWPHRRLITLIFADRAELAVMVVIRRELPRTRVAGPARGLSRRSHEDPPSRVPPDRRPLCSSSVIVVVLAVPP